MEKITLGKLKTRETPNQQRAVERVCLILNTAAEILCESDSDKLNTTQIATRAHIPVSSIYRYFPSVDDILKELYLQTAGALRKKLFAVFDDLEAYPTWQSRLTAALTMQKSYLDENPFYHHLLLKFMNSRATVAVEHEEHYELVDFLEARWHAGLDGFHDGDPRIVASTTIQIALAMEDMAAASIPYGRMDAYTLETFKALNAYLSLYLSN